MVETLVDLAKSRFTPYYTPYTGLISLVLPRPAQASIVLTSLTLFLIVALFALETSLTLFLKSSIKEISGPFVSK